MDKTITIAKGKRTSRIEIIQELLKDLDPNLIENKTSIEDYDKFFGKQYQVASKSFKISIKVEEIL